MEANSIASTTATSPALPLIVSPQQPSDAPPPIAELLAAGASATDGAVASMDAENKAPPCKRTKKCTSDVWNHFIQFEKKKTTEDGTEIVEKWAKCKQCTYQAASLKKFYLTIIMHEYPFNIVEHEYFVDFIKSLRPTFPIKSRITVRKDILNIFVEEKKKLYEYFKTINCRFSTTMDMWTSNQNKSYMCITVHWVDDNWCMQKRIVKFMHVGGHHDGKKLCSEFYDSIIDWNLDRRLLALTLDNASANDKCVHGVVTKLSKISPLICDGLFFHVRCFNHILNLVAQDGLKKIASAISNIRNTITIVKNSPLQFEEFKKCASECDLDISKGLTLDVPTRWNSTYLMLRSAIYYQEAFGRLFLRQEKKYGKYKPTKANWASATSISACLKPFFDATELFSGTSYPTANLFFRKFCQIKLAIAEWCVNSDEVIKAMAVSMQIKYNKYWEKSNMALSVATFLDPRYKTKLVEYFAKRIYPTNATQEFDKFISVVNQLFEAYASTSNATSTKTAGAIVQSELDVLDELDDDNDLDIENFLHNSSESSKGTKSELEVYMEQPLVKWTAKDGTFDILSWWKLKQAELPILSRLARDVLAIQVSTVASESAFSAGGRVVDPFRTRLDPEIVQALICTKDWTAASRKGGTIASVMTELDMEGLEQRFASLMETIVGLPKEDTIPDDMGEEEDMMETDNEMEE